MLIAILRYEREPRKKIIELRSLSYSIVVVTSGGWLRRAPGPWCHGSASARRLERSAFCPHADDTFCLSLSPSTVAHGIFSSLDDPHHSFILHSLSSITLLKLNSPRPFLSPSSLSRLDAISDKRRLSYMYVHLPRLTNCH
jgi:hypothetical protein